MEFYDLVLIGASFFSLGAAYECKGRSLIIDSKAKPGYEFIDAFYNGEAYDRPIKTPKGRAFAQYFKQSGLLDTVYIPEWTPYLSRWICENEIDMLFFTSVLSVDKEGEYSKITLYNTMGKQEILARRIIDTRTEEFTEKQLNGLVCGGKVKAFGPSIKVKEFEKISLVEFTVPENYSYTQARAHIFKIWEGRPEQYQSVKIAAIADQFFKRPALEKRVVSDSIWHYYSAFYDNPLLAFDKGCEIGGVCCD